MTDEEFLLFDRLEKIKSVIGKYGEENFYVSFSGGKDSTVLSALVDMAIPGNEIPRVFADTGIELNIIRDFVKHKAEVDSRFVIIKPSVPIKKMLETEGYPFKSKEHSHILDIYQRHGNSVMTPKRYLNERPGYGNRFRCPQILRYQFSEDFKLRVSDKCCTRMKEEPLKKYEIQSNKPYSILGIMPSEGGRRMTAKCVAFQGKKFKSFHPLVVVTKEWEDWFIRQYNIEICDIYKSPYNATRTGCKGCPFAIDLQKNLDTLQKYFPRERAV